MRPGCNRTAELDPCRQSTGRAEDCGDPVVESCRKLKLPVCYYLAARFFSDSLIARSSASRPHSRGMGRPALMTGLLV
jgi:hypothetical protein